MAHKHKATARRRPARCPVPPLPQSPGPPSCRPRPGTGTWRGDARRARQPEGRHGDGLEAASSAKGFSAARGMMGRMRCSIQSQRGLPCSQCWAQPCAPARVQVHALLVQQVLEPPRGGHHHVDAALEQVQLGAQVYAADAQHGAQLWEPALCQHLGVVVHDLVSLLGQLAAGADDQTLLLGWGRGGEGGCKGQPSACKACPISGSAAQRGTGGPFALGRATYHGPLPRDQRQPHLLLQRNHQHRRAEHQRLA